MDNLQTFTISLVVLYHVGGVYEVPVCGAGSGSSMIPIPSPGLASLIILPVCIGAAHIVRKAPLVSKVL